MQNTTALAHWVPLPRLTLGRQQFCPLWLLYHEYKRHHSEKGKLRLSVIIKIFLSPQTSRKGLRDLTRGPGPIL